MDKARKARIEAYSAQLFLLTPQGIRHDEYVNVCKIKGRYILFTKFTQKYSYYKYNIQAVSSITSTLSNQLITRLKLD